MCTHKISYHQGICSPFVTLTILAVKNYTNQQFNKIIGTNRISASDYCLHKQIRFHNAIEFYQINWKKMLALYAFFYNFYGDTTTESATFPYKTDQSKDKTNRM